MNGFADALRTLLAALEAVSTAHPEIHDTLVRERLRDAVEAGFVQGRAGVRPTRFGLHAEEADARVDAALDAFVAAANAAAAREGLAPGPARRRAFQDPDVLSPGGLPYDEFFGHVPLD